MNLKFRYSCHKLWALPLWWSVAVAPARKNCLPPSWKNSTQEQLSERKLEAQCWRRAKASVPQLSPVL